MSHESEVSIVRLVPGATQVLSFLLPGSRLPEIDGNKTHQGSENGERKSQLSKYSRPLTLVCNLGGKHNEQQQSLKYEMTGIFAKQVTNEIKVSLNLRKKQFS